MKPLFDVWVCQGRMCTGNGSDAVAERARDQAASYDGGPHADRCRVLRGGCYGLCEIGPNVVVRRHEHQRPDPDADRLSLTHDKNESVYSGMSPADIDGVLHAHLVYDLDVPELSRLARERDLPPQSPVAAKLRALRERRKTATPPPR
ncbi:MAG TPA: (2Fe-2S) ferredoxin domain-containing protein [Myxococcota bacterium]